LRDSSTSSASFLRTLQNSASTRVESPESSPSSKRALPGPAFLIAPDQLPHILAGRAVAALCLRLDISLSSSGKDTFRFEATRIRARWRSGMRMHPQHAKAVKYLIARLSHLEGIRTHNHNVMSERYPKVFTTKRVLNYRKRGASTGSDGGSAMAGFLILGLGWAGNSIRSVSSRICTYSDGWV